jgi:Tol biopolymer transport system component
MIAFSSTRNGNENIFVQQLGVGEARNITTGSWHDTRPIWSHDGQEIAFLSDRGRQSGIWIVPFFSGAPELLSRIDQEAEMVGWSRDGATIFYELKGDLFSLDRATKRSEQLTRLAPRLRANSFRLSPEEKRIVFAGAETANSGSYGPIDIWVSGLRGEGVRRVQR